MLKVAIKPINKKGFDKIWEWKGYKEDKVVSVRIPEKLYRELEQTRDRVGAGSVSDVVRTLLSQTIEKENHRR